MKNLVLILLFFSTIASAQEESKFEIKDNLYKVGLFRNISLSDNLTLQNGIAVRKNLDFITLEVPILLKQNLSDKWSTFLGVQSRTVIYSNFPESFNIEKPSNSYLTIGTEYEFKHNTTGNLTIGFPLDLQLGIKF
jgi:hypothetical protein